MTLGQDESNQRPPPPPPAPPTTVAAQPEPDERLEIAYEAARNSLMMQDQTLGNLRNRATSVLSTAALFTSFSTGIGLIGGSHALSGAKGIALLIVVIAIGFFVLSALWPEEWLFGPLAREIMAKIDVKQYVGDGEPLPPIDVDQIRRDSIKTMIDGYKTNNEVLTDKRRAFQRAAVLLVIEVGLLVLMLWV